MPDKQDQKKKEGHRPEKREERVQATHESDRRRHEETGEPTTHLPQTPMITRDEADDDLQDANVHSGK